MSDVKEQQSLPLYQIIGAPLMALVQADVQAAQATAEYIEEMGFVTPATEENTDDLESLGDLRMVTFTYQKPASDGKTTTFQVQIPLLSLLPIPILQIEDAQFEFSVQVHDAYEEDITTTAGTDSEDHHYLSTTRVNFRGGMAKNASDYEMKVNLNVTQADMPAGISTLLKMMDQSVYSGTITD